MVDEIGPREIHQTRHCVTWVERLQIEFGLGATDGRVGRLQNRDEQRLLVAEVVIEERLVDAGASGDLGYRGVSAKTCKGVFRAFANRALCLERGGGAFQSSEDLTTLPVLPLQQDLATASALGLDHCERNGHHYFPGLDVVPAPEADAALAAHSDLYERRGERAVLRIEDGAIALGSIRSTGYGYDMPISWSVRLPLDRLEQELI